MVAGWVDDKFAAQPRACFSLGGCASCGIGRFAGSTRLFANSAVAIMSAA